MPLGQQDPDRPQQLASGSLKLYSRARTINRLAPLSLRVCNSRSRVLFLPQARHGCVNSAVIFREDRQRAGIERVNVSAYSPA